MKSTDLNRLFRDMDQDARILAQCEITKLQWIKAAANQAAQKVISELNVIKNNHLIVFNSKVLNEMSSEIDDPILDNLLNKNISVNITSPSILGQSLIFKDMIKSNKIFTDYNKIFDYISSPFNTANDSLLKANSQTELQPIKNAFLQDLNHLNKYFEYSEGNNNQSPTSEIACKESLLKVAEDIVLKLDDFNKIKAEQEHIEQEILPNNFNQIIQKSLEVQNKQPLTELEKALTRIKELEDQNNKKDMRIKELEDQNEEKLFEALNKKENESKQFEKEFKAKDKMIEEQSHTISDLREDKIELRLEKNEWKTKYEVKDNSLQKMIEKLTIEKAKVSEITQKFGLHNSDDHSFNSWEKLDQGVSIMGKDNLEDQNLD